MAQSFFYDELNKIFTCFGMALYNLENLLSEGYRMNVYRFA